jgi:hypothetical protein
MLLRRIYSQVLALPVLLPLIGAAFAQPMPYTIDASPPRTLTRSGAGDTVAFGPVSLTFPPGWSFQRTGNLSKGISDKGTVAFVSVLVATDATVRAGVLTEERLAAGKARALAETKDACGTTSEPTVEVILKDASAAIFASGCQEATRDGLSYAVRYDIYSHKGMVQVMFAGSGSQSQARVVHDKVAKSQVW